MSNKKNITLALDKDDYNYLDKLKRELKAKNITQIFYEIIDFYKEFKPIRDELILREQTIDEKLSSLKTIVNNLQIRLSNMVTKNEFEELKQNVEMNIDTKNILASIFSDSERAF